MGALGPDVIPDAFCLTYCVSFINFKCQLVVHTCLFGPSLCCITLVIHLPASYRQ